MTESHKKAAWTQAETMIIDHFSGAARRTGHQDAEIQESRKAAMAVFRNNGLPSRRMENWHYTDLRTQLAHVAPYNEHAGGAPVPPLASESTVLSVVNGKAVVPAAPPSSAAAVTLESLFADGRTGLPRDFSADDVIGQLNTAFVSDGWAVNIPQDASSEAIIELQNIQNGAQSHVRFPFTVGRNATITVIERQLGNDEESFLSSVSTLDIAAEAKVTWIIIRERGSASTELNAFHARLAENAGLRLYLINAGAHLLRQEISIDLEGRGADFQLRGINLLSGKTHTDTTMTVRHLFEATTSSEIIRNVVMDEARGVFQGMIRVAREAQKTDARMACNSLILSDRAQFDAKPELEIFADDVACGHGATVAEIDNDHLFYLMARGIPEARARAMLVRAFVGELIAELGKGELENRLQPVLDHWLHAHV